MRLFIGIKVPDELRGAIQRALADVSLAPMDFRAIDPDKWHFTLAFLGETDAQHVDALDVLIRHAVTRVPHGVFEFSSLETFPAKHPSYIVVRARAMPAEDWMNFIERLRDLVSVAAPNIDRKPWIPHVSVARTRKGKLLPTWAQRIPPFAWTPSELTLVSSEAGPHGSIYTDLHVYPFNI